LRAEGIAGQSPPPARVSPSRAAAVPLATPGLADGQGCSAALTPEGEEETMAAPKFIEIDGRHFVWRDLLRRRREQRMAPKPSSPPCSNARRIYGIGSIDEARAYLAHPLLAPRLDLCTRIVLASESPSVHAIFGSPDDLKFRSCMTLFSLAADDQDNAFRQALDRWCDGQPDEQTLALIGARG
jgi:uncharacterized protein (DUF1810 family)